jgi:hypothetical protein
MRVPKDVAEEVRRKMDAATRNGVNSSRWIDADVLARIANQALTLGKDTDIIDHVMNCLLPLVPSRFKRAVICRTIRRMLSQSDCKAQQQARRNRRHVSKNPTARLPKSPHTLAKALGTLSVLDATQRVNEALAAFARFFMVRFPRAGFMLAIDEIDIDAYSEPTDKRPHNDLREHVRGGKEATPVHRYYVAVILMPAMRAKIPVYYELHSFADPLTGETSDKLPRLPDIVKRILATVENFPRLPSHILVDRGFESQEVHNLFIDLRKRHPDSCVLVTPVRSIRYAHDDAQLDPEIADLVRKKDRRNLLAGPISPRVLRERAREFAPIPVKADRSAFVGIIDGRDPWAPQTMNPGLWLIIMVYKTADQNDDVEAVDLGDGWFAHMTYTTQEGLTPPRAYELSRLYTLRNYIESTFQQLRREFMISGLQDMGSRVFVFGMCLLLLAVHALKRIWRGHFVTPGRFDYALDDFLLDVKGEYSFPDEPPP